ncbi:MAG: DUF2442 domain-containing protein [Candidatus Sumerlaeota bacterium]|nr:DUF2442 domain-containing protein [Candidatus Sumerlaeota bacterium]
MSHPIYKVLSFEIIAPYTLRIKFNDQFERTVDFCSVLEGEIYRPLRNLSLFNQVKIDPEINTLVWPNGADFDPATLHDWPEQVEALRDRLNQQELTAA